VKPLMARRRKPGRLHWRRLTLALMISLAVVAAFLAFDGAPLPDMIEGQTLNWRFRLRGPVPPPADVAIIAIDDQTFNTLNRWPLPRRVLAEAVDRLQAADAAVIGIDLLLVDPEQPSSGIVLSPGDQQLYEALRAANRAVLSFAFITFGPPKPPDAARQQALEAASFRAVEWPAGTSSRDLLQATGALAPMAPFLEFATIGHTNAPLDRDGAVRRLPVAIGLGDQLVPAFPVEVARRFRGLAPSEVGLSVGHELHLGPQTIALDPGTRLLLNYYGGSGTIETLSLIDLVQGRIPPEKLAHRAVVIGATAIGAGDSFVTPYSGALPGAEVLATATANLLDNTALRRGPSAVTWDVVAIILLGLVTFAAAHLPVPGAAAIAALAALLGWGAVAQLAFESRLLWLNMTFPAASILLNAGAAATLGALAERRLRREAQRQRENLSRYHSPVIANLLADGDKAALPEHEQPAAILFVDMADSTRRTEHMAPGETAQFLREFHRRIEAAVLAHGGVLDRFTGDGAMVIFGVPAPRPDDAVSALACARDLTQEIAQWSAELAVDGSPPLRIRIGVHFGSVVIATLGGETQRQLTAAGDTVNVASRLEALMRGRGAAIAISGAVVEAVLAVGRADLLAGFAPLPDQPIRGRKGRIAVWVAQGGGAAGSAASPAS
jgi:adenylate cyclase